MEFKKFIKEKLLTIILIIFSLITIEIFFMAYPVGNFIKIYVPVIITIAYLIGLLYEYYIKKKYYDQMQKMLEELGEKYLITEVVKAPNLI